MGHSSRISAVYLRRPSRELSCSRKAEVFRHAHHTSDMLAGLVEHNHSMFFRSKTARDLAEAMLHRVYVGTWHNRGHLGVALGTDCAEQIGRFGARLGAARSAGYAGSSEEPGFAVGFRQKAIDSGLEIDGSLPSSPQ